MFPGPHATVYRNEAGEPLGWSDESSYEPEYDDRDCDRWDESDDSDIEEYCELCEDEHAAGECPEATDGK